MTIEHREIGDSQIHRVPNWIVGGLPALSAVVVSELDLHKFAYVTGQGYYALTAVFPAPVWERVGGEEIAGTDDVPNQSGVTGVTTTDALDQLDTDIGAVSATLASLGSDAVQNQSTVAGVSVSDALDNVDAAALAAQGTAASAQAAATTAQSEVDALEIVVATLANDINKLTIIDSTVTNNVLPLQRATLLRVDTAGASTVTIDAAARDVGGEFYVAQIGAGTLTLVASGTTLVGETLVSSGQYHVFKIVYRGGASYDVQSISKPNLRMYAESPDSDATLPSAGLMTDSIALGRAIIPNSTSEGGNVDQNLCYGPSNLFRHFGAPATGQLCKNNIAMGRSLALSFGNTSPLSNAIVEHCVALGGDVNVLYGNSTGGGVTTRYSVLVGGRAGGVSGTYSVGIANDAAGTQVANYSVVMSCKSLAITDNHCVAIASTSGGAGIGGGVNDNAHVVIAAGNTTEIPTFSKFNVQIATTGAVTFGNVDRGVLLSSTGTTFPNSVSNVFVACSSSGIVGHDFVTKINSAGSSTCAFENIESSSTNSARRRTAMGYATTTGMAAVTELYCRVGTASQTDAQVEPTAASNDVPRAVNQIVTNNGQAARHRLEVLITSTNCNHVYAATVHVTFHSPSGAGTVNRIAIAKDNVHTVGDGIGWDVDVYAVGNRLVVKTTFGVATNDVSCFVDHHVVGREV